MPSHIFTRVGYWRDPIGSNIAAARASGAARAGDPAAARAEIAKPAELRDKLREAKDAYWTERVDIQWQVATAFVLYAEGKHDDALNALSAAAVALVEGADTVRPEIAQARAFMAKKSCWICGDDQEHRRAQRR